MTTTDQKPKAQDSLPEITQEMAAKAVEAALRAKAAARALVKADTARKDGALAAIARNISQMKGQILAANGLDMEAARKSGMKASMMDRLRLDEGRIDAIVKALDEVRLLKDPVGQVTDSYRCPNGLSVERVRIPLGVVLMIYESRPNVTPDAAALCLKSGNAAILRGGKEAIHSNLALGDAIRAGLKEAGLPEDAVQVVDTPDRGLMLSLIRQDESIDLCIPRGGESLIRFVAANARVPVLKHFKGVCHVYLHGSADLKKAVAIVLNAKAQRTGVCNAAECLLVDRAAKGLLAPVCQALVDAGVEIRADQDSLVELCAHRIPASPAREDDFGREFLDKIIAVRMVDSIDGAMDHIARYGSMHTEAIVAEDAAAADRFVNEVVASAVMVNASTRFNDGGELGLGAEIGISTTKLHAFGPMGLEELTARKFVVRGDGQVRG